MSQACYTTGIGRTAYYVRLDSDKMFANKMGLAQEYVIIKAKQLVVQEIEDGNLAAAKWWLERRARDEFGNQPRLSKEPEQTYDDTYSLEQVMEELRRNADIAITQAEGQMVQSSPPAVRC